MSVRAFDLERFLNGAEMAVLVRVEAVFGSTPREKDTEMVVSADGQFGTIGGGQLEFLAIDQARGLLRSGGHSDRLDIPLGPGIGQCCGGRVVLSFARLDGVARTDLLSVWQAREAARPCVYVFGAGHVGRALAAALGLLPLSVTVIDTRPVFLNDLPEGVAALASPMPEAEVRAAPAGSAFVAVTHDHALDFLITREALARTDAAYVGMIGSKTKRAQFRRWHAREGGDPDRLAALYCPIGGSAVDDKRPEIIAALTSAEIIGTMASAKGAGHADKSAPGRVQEKS